MEDLSEVRRVLEEQDALLERLTQAANPYGTVVARDGDYLVLAADGKLIRVQPHPDAVVGAQVVVSGETGQILEISTLTHAGPVAVVRRVVEPGRLEIEAETGAAVRRYDPSLDAAKLQPGVRVMMDASGTVALQILETHGDRYAVESAAVAWEDIGGNEVAKEELRETIAILRGGTELHAAYGVKAPKGLLLYGPPGCGKTMLGKAAATDLSSDGRGAFLYVKGPEILSKYVGVAEANVRELFEAARKTHKETGQPVVIFVDEADAILQKRGTGLSSDMEKTIVPAFLTEMDGLADSSAFVILATNRADTLDPAVIREGRVDRKINVERPGPDQGRAILALNLANVPVAPDHSAEELVEAGTAALYRIGSPAADSMSGALIVAAVERAKRRAIRRDTLTGSLRGVTTEDIHLAVAEIEQEY